MSPRAGLYLLGVLFGVNIGLGVLLLVSGRELGAMSLGAAAFLLYIAPLVWQHDEKGRS